MDKKLFIFDVGGVVVFHPSFLEGFARRYNLDIRKVYADWVAYNKPIMDGFNGPEIMYAMFAHKYNLDLTGDDVMMTYYHPVPNPPMIRVIEQLRRSGHRVVAGSNTYAGHWDFCKAMPDKPLECFDKLYASHEIHLSKPDEEFFTYIMKSEGYTPEQTVFTDDSMENIRAAQELGITTFNYTQDNKALEEFFRPYLV